ncbi:MAG: chaperonin GroEL, partial [Chloroflexi bacterium]|nr:chaperonin GroEL [Chloroflexota bacterium]
VEEGIVPGGGVALVRAGEALDSLDPETADERTGIGVLKTALQAPLKLISENTGVSGEVVLWETLQREGSWGYNAETGEYGDLLELGIADPAKVTRSAVENAASLAAMVLTTESLITDIIEKPKAGQPPMPDYYD